jgi:hypothetical protein
MDESPSRASRRNPKEVISRQRGMIRQLLWAPEKAGVQQESPQILQEIHSRPSSDAR